MKRTQWVVVMHFDRSNNQTIKFDSKAAALECIRVAVFSNEDCVNFSCYKEEVKKSTLEDKLDELTRLMQMRDLALSKM
jgi:hypothetical protein